MDNMCEAHNAQKIAQKEAEAALEEQKKEAAAAQAADASGGNEQL
jgi:hypothetical protein